MQPTNITLPDQPEMPQPANLSTPQSAGQSRKDLPRKHRAAAIRTEAQRNVCTARRDRESRIRRTAPGRDVNAAGKPLQGEVSAPASRRLFSTAAGRATTVVKIMRTGTLQGLEPRRTPQKTV